MDTTGRKSLNAVLGEAWWIRLYSELTMTLSLAHMLSGPACAEEFAGLVSKQVGVDMPVLTGWVTEQVQPDRGRPNVEAHLDNSEGDVSLVKIEGKLGAPMSNPSPRTN